MWLKGIIAGVILIVAGLTVSYAQQVADEPALDAPTSQEAPDVADLNAPDDASGAEGDGLDEAAGDAPEAVDRVRRRPDWAEMEAMVTEKMKANPTVAEPTAPRMAGPDRYRKILEARKAAKAAKSNGSVTVMAPEAVAKVLKTPKKRATSTSAPPVVQRTAGAEALAAKITTLGAPKVAAAEAAYIYLQYDKAPIGAIVRSYSQKAGRPLIGDYNVGGTVSFHDSEPYTLVEAFDTLNILLAMNNYRMVEDGRFLRLTPLSELQNMPLPFKRGLAEFDGYRDEELVTVLLPVMYMSPGEASELIVRMVNNDYGAIASLPKSKGLLITDRLSNIRRIAEFLKMIDTAEASDSGNVRIVELEHARARDVAKVIDNLWGAAAAPKRMRYDEKRKRNIPLPPDPKDIIRTAFDDRTNVLVLSGDPSKLTLAEEMVHKLDTETGPDVGGTRVFELKNAKATELADTLTRLMGASSPVIRGRRRMPTTGGDETRIVGDAATNRLIVTAPVDKMARIEKLVEALDEAVADGAGMRVFRLKVADAQQMANIITAATRKTQTGPRGRRTTTSTLTVSADSRTNTLIIAGNAGDINTAAKLIEELDSESPAESQEIRVIHLESGDARQLAQSLLRILSTGGSAPTMRGRRMPSLSRGSSTARVRIEADQSSNSLIIAAPATKWPEIEKVLAELKAATSPTESVTRLIPLKVASATEMAATLQKIFSPFSRSRSRGMPTLGAQVVIAPSERANALLVTASTDDQERIAELIGQMDVESAEKVEPIVMFQLIAADAEKVAVALKGMLPPARRGQMQKVLISTDTRTNSVLVRAPAAERKMIEEMINRLDLATSKTARETRILPLKNASASAMAPMIQQLYAGSGSSLSMSMRRGRRVAPSLTGGDDDRVIVAVAPGDKALVIDAPSEKIDRIAQLVTSLDEEGDLVGRLLPRSYTLTNADARGLAQSLTRLFTDRSQFRRNSSAAPASAEPQPRFDAEQRSNTLLVAATTEQYEIIETLIRKMESSASEARVQVRMFTLVHTKAAAIQQTVADVLNSQTGGTGRRGAPGVTVSPDERTNTLTVSAPGKYMAAAEQVIAALDSPEAAANEVTTKIVHLTNSDANELATALNSALAGQSSTPSFGRNRRGRPSMQMTNLGGRKLTVTPNPGGRSLLLTGSAEDIEFAEGLISQLDSRENASAAVVRTYRIEHGDAEKIAKVLNDTVVRGQPRALRGSTQVPIRVTADTDANSVVVSGAAAMHEMIAATLEQLDTPDAVSGQSTVEIVQLANAKADELAAALNAAAGIDPRRRGMGQPVSAVGGSNALLLTGKPDEIAERKKLIAELDVASAQLASTTKIFPLQFAEAADLVEVLQTMLADTAMGGRMNFSNRGRRGLSLPSVGQVRVAAQPRTNSIIVQGAPEKVALAAEMIAQFDVADAGQRTVIEIVQLENAQAASLAEAINASLAAQQQQSFGRSRFNRGRMTLTAQPDDQVVVTAEPNSNSVLVRGPAKDVPPVLAMIRRLDGSGTSNVPEMRTYKLEKNDASNMVDGLGSLFRDIIKQAPVAGSGVRGGRSQPAPFSIGADTRTNSLVVSTTKAYFAMFEELLNKLEKTDVVERQVHYVNLVNADAYDLASQLDNMFLDRTGPDAPIIEADLFSNSITIIAKDLDFQRMEPIIQQIDAVPTRTVRVLSISAMRAEQLAEQLKRVYPQVSDGDLMVVDEIPADKTKPSTPPSTAGAPGAEILRSDDTHVQNLPAGAAAPVREPVMVAVDKVTNSLLIAGTRQELDNLEDLIRQLSVGAESAEAEYRWFKIEQADPDSVAATLSRLFNPPKVRAQAKSRGKTNNKNNKSGDNEKKPTAPEAPTMVASAPPVITVVADPRTRHVIVRAKPTDFDLIEGIIQQLDQVTTVVTELRTFSLKNTDATEIVANLQELFRLSVSRRTPSGKGGLPNLQRAGAIKQLHEFRGVDGEPVQVDAASMIGMTANTTTNSVVVSAPADAMLIIAGLIQELDQSAGESTKAVVRLYPVVDGDVAAMASTLQQIFIETNTGRGGARRGPAMANETPIVITSDAAGKVVIVSAPLDKHELIAATLADVRAAQQTAGQTVIKVYKLQHTTADGVAAAITGAFGPGTTSSGGRTRGRGRQATPSVGALRVTADTASNSVVVSATDAEHERIGDIVRQMDTPPGGVLSVRPIVLAHGNAADIAKLLTRVFVTQSTGGGRGGAPAKSVVIEGDRESRMLMVRADDETFERIKTMAEQMDAAGDSRPGVFILPLARAKAVQMAATVTDLYQQRVKVAKSNGITVDPMAITADQRSNALILACSAEQFKQVSMWVNQIEEMNPRKGSPRMISLENADPTEVEQAIRQLFGGSAPARGGSGAGELPFEMTVLPTQRKLLIDASDEDFQTILELVQALDAAAKADRPEIKFFELTHADSSQVAQSLTQVFTKIARPGHPEDVVTITALPKTNAVMVAGTAQRLSDAAGLIKQLDTETISPKMEFRVYPLVHAKPTKVISLLEKLLAEYRKSRPNEPIAITADEPTRSIVVTAQGKTFEQVEKILAAIDIEPAVAATNVAVIALVKADADALADVLNEMLRPSAEGQVTDEARALQEHVRRLRVSGRDGRALPELDLNKPIKISADSANEGSNSLIVSSTPENIIALTAIVKMMDTVPISEEAGVKLVQLKHADAESVLAVLQDIFTQGAKNLSGKTGGPVAGKAEPTKTEGKGLVRPLNVSADPRTNTLVLSGSVETLALAQRVIAELDTETDGLATEVKLFQLRFADATKMAPILESVFSEDDSPSAEAEGLRTHVTRLIRNGAGGGKLATDFAKTRSAMTIEADELTNTLVVAARQDMMPLIADVIGSMDIPGAGSMNSVRIFPLTHADATRLAEVIEGLYSGPNAKLIRVEDTPTIQVDTRTNSLVVSASQSTFAMVLSLLTSLDAEVPVELRDIRLIPLANADAVALASVVGEMMDARVERLDSLGAKDAESLRVIVLADARSNSLIVGGSPEGYQLVKDLAAQLDGASPALSGQIQVIPLVHANAGTISTTLGDLFDKRYNAARTDDVKRQKPVILPDLRTNSLLVAANQDDSRVLTSLLAKLDGKPTDPSVQLVVIPLVHNDAGVVGPMIQDIFTARLKSMTPAGQETAPQDNVDVVSDAMINGLVISASKDNLELIRGLIAKVDVEPAAVTGIVRMYPLINADAERIAGMLKDLVSDGLYKPGMAAAKDNSLLEAREKVSIVADTRTNVLVVSASAENFAVIEEVIRRLDSTDDVGLLGSIRVYNLKRADAAKLAPTLKDFFQSKLAAEEATSGDSRALDVTIVADTRTNCLLVAGSRESFNAIEAMIAKLDGDTETLGDAPRVFTLAKADATAVVEMITELYTSRGGLEAAGLSLTADVRTNSVVISGGSGDVERIGEIIARVDTEIVTRVTEIRVFPLRQADATELADLLTTLLTDSLKSPTSDGADRQSLLQFIRKVPGGKEMVTRALQEGVLITPDSRSNALVVAAPADAIPLLSNLIDALDNVTAPAAQIRIFRLENSDAVKMAEVLADLFRLEPGLEDVKAASYTLTSADAAKSGATLTMGAADAAALTVTVDGRTNTLLIGGSKQYVDMAAEVIEKLDGVPGQERVSVVYHLRNANALNIEEAVTAWLDAENQRLDDALGDNRGSGLQILESQISVVAVKSSSTLGEESETSNTLLISGSSRNIDSVMEMIAQLDEPQPQVHISVILAEVTLDDSSEFGVDWDIGPNAGREAALGINIAPSGREARGSTFLGAASAFGAPGSGLNLSFTSGDLALWLRAMQTEGNFELIARPNIMAIDNQTASVNIGQRMPFISNVRVLDNGSTYNTVTYEDIGVNLEVTPRISPDGFVLMEVAPEISSASDSSVEIAPGASSAIYTSRKVRTIVSVRDGHTIVIGGLITTQEQERETKIPFLGDIPYLGHLFKSTSKDKVRTEFLIILTPRIVRNSVDAAQVTRQEIGRTHLKEKTLAPFDSTLFSTGDPFKAKANQPVSTPVPVAPTRGAGPVVRVMGAKK